MAENSFSQTHESVYGNMRCVLGQLTWNDTTSTGKDQTVGLETIYGAFSSHASTLRHSGNAIGCDATAGSTMDILALGI